MPTQLELGDKIGSIARKLITPVSVAGAVVVGVCLWALITAWGPISAGHPSYLVFYGATFAVALVSIYRSVQRSARRRTVLSMLSSLALLLLASASLWLRPFSAGDDALEALDSPDQYVVSTTGTAIRLEPKGETSAVGLIFQPGARVDARAYASMMGEIAAEGHPVVIVKQPLGIGFLALGSIRGILEESSEATWVGAGHSLGGVAASEAADEGIAGLVLWASYPAGDISDTTLDVTSIYGTADGIATVADITESEGRLPPATVFIPVEGAIHSFFGDYGLQPGDGTPTVDRAAAQEIIVKATIDVLRGVPSPVG